MLILGLCKINIAPYGENFYYLTEIKFKIWSYSFEKFFITEKL